MKNRFQIKWNQDDIAKAFKISSEDVQEYLTDGRRVSFAIERRLMRDHEGWELAPSEGAGYDLLDPDGGKWEVRSITKNGVYFNPSNQVGSSRKFNEGGFQAKLGELKGFILGDIVGFPIVKIYKFPVGNVLRWHQAKLLGKTTKVTRKKFLEVLAPDIQL